MQFLLHYRDCSAPVARVLILVGSLQVTQILDARTKLLQRMHNLSDVRNHLALRAVGILLPSRQRPSTHPSHEARLQSLEVCLHLLRFGLLDCFHIGFLFPMSLSMSLGTPMANRPTVAAAAYCTHMPCSPGFPWLLLPSIVSRWFVARCSFVHAIVSESPRKPTVTPNRVSGCADKRCVRGAASRAGAARES